MSLFTWFGLLLRNRFRLHPLRWPMAACLTLFALFNSVAGRLQTLCYGRRIRQAKVESPIFILGHWRSGTTYLHELLALDAGFGTPTTYQVYAPHHFLLTERFAARYLSFLSPRVRPMDNVAVGMQSPQEDEWALCNLGIPSPYLRTAFPNERPPFLEYLTLRDVSPDAQLRWKRTLYDFLAAVVCQTPKRLVLKSPPHMGRVRLLLEMFPDAKFIHIHRNPFEVFPSTVRMWESFDRTQGLQQFTGAGLEEFVFEAHDRLYRAFEEDRQLLGPSQLCEVRYEELVSDPIAQIERVYSELNLGGFDSVRRRLTDYVASRKNHQPNQHRLSPAEHALIEQRWSAHLKRYGYADASTSGEGNTNPAAL